MIQLHCGIFIFDAQDTILLCVLLVLVLLDYRKCKSLDDAFK